MHYKSVIISVLAIAATVSAYDDDWDSSSCSCDYDCHHPQCGTDGETYENPCFLKCRNDYMKKTFGKTVHVLHYGECKTKDLKDSHMDLAKPNYFKYCGKLDHASAATPAKTIVWDQSKDANEDNGHYDNENQGGKTVDEDGGDDGQYHESNDDDQSTKNWEDSGDKGNYNCGDDSHSPVEEYKNNESDDNSISKTKSEMQTTEAPTTKAIAIWDENQCICDKNDNSPQCGSDWQTYANPCFVKCRNDYLNKISGLPIYVVYAGKCFEPIIEVENNGDNESNCDSDDTQMLGESDQKNDDDYSNSDDNGIHLSKNVGEPNQNNDESGDNMHHNIILTPTTEVPTPKAVEPWDQTSCACDKSENNPQCGSDWQTYSSTCFVKCRNDYLNRISGLPIYIVYAGKCYEPLLNDENNSDDEINCDDDGTNLSKNLGEPNQNKEDDSGDNVHHNIILTPTTEAPTTKAVEPWDQTSCACDKNENNPQCGSDWQTYSSTCFVKCRNDYLNRISGLPIYIVYAGKCFEPLVNVENNGDDESNCDDDGTDLSKNLGEPNQNEGDDSGDNINHNIILTPTTEAPTTKKVEPWEQTSCACDKSENSPQCGSDWQTYSSTCFVKCRNDYLNRISGLPIYVVYAGKCFEPIIVVENNGDDESNCDDDGTNLSKNLGEPNQNKEDGSDDNMNHNTISFPTTEAPTTKAVEPWDQTSCACDKNENNPQCGSDWQTYSSTCFVKCRNDYLNRISGLPIYVVYAGKCFEPLVNVENNGDDESNCDDDGTDLSKNLGQPDQNEGDDSGDNMNHNTISFPTTEAPTTKAVEPWDQTSCVCDKSENSPQCGSDWQTYSSTCFIKCRNDYLNRISGLPIYVVYAGKCFEPIIVVENNGDDESNCDDDGTNLSKNLGEPNQNKEDGSDDNMNHNTIAFPTTEAPTTKAVEPWDQTSCVCDKSENNPQCGSDWQTYSSTCFVKCRSDYLNRISGLPIYIVYAGKCFEPLVNVENNGDDESNCDDDGTDLSKNLGEPNQNEGDDSGDNINHNIILTPTTEAPTTKKVEPWDQTSCACDKSENNPQCGSDWQTYSSTCFVKCRNDYLNRISGLPIYVVYSGKCFEPLVNVENNGKDSEDESNYDDDGTHISKNLDEPDQNEEDDNSNHIILTKTTNAPATKAVEPWDQTSCACDKSENNPQCGSDWQTYSSTCFVKCRNDYLNRISGLPIYIVYAGKCYEPVTNVLPKDLYSDDNDSDCSGKSQGLKSLDESEGPENDNDGEWVEENYTNESDHDAQPTRLRDSNAAHTNCHKQKNYDDSVNNDGSENDDGQWHDNGCHH